MQVKEDEMSGLQKDINRRTAALARKLSAKAGSPLALVAALLFILGWAVAGPFYGFSESWQLVVNSGTTIVTFILAISIQYTQNRDSRAIHMKLNRILERSEDLQDTLESIERELDSDGTSI